MEKQLDIVSFVRKNTKFKFRVGDVVQSKRKNVFTILSQVTINNRDYFWKGYKVRNMRSSCTYTVDIEQAHTRYTKMGKAAKVLYGAKV